MTGGEHITTSLDQIYFGGKWVVAASEDGKEAAVPDVHVKWGRVIKMVTNERISKFGWAIGGISSGQNTSSRIISISFFIACLLCVLPFV